jgi:TolB protein
MPRVTWRLATGMGVLGALALLALNLRAEPDPRAAPPPAAAPFRLQLLASDSAGGGDGAISPSGDAFVTSSRRSGNWEIWLFELRTGTWRQLTDDPGDDFEAQWSPDGERLVFTSTRAGQKDLWTLSLADGALARLTDGEHDDEYPQWSPDGRSIVYTSGAWGDNHFFVIPAGGGEPRRVTRIPGRGGACSFDPRGGSLICHRYGEGSGDILRIDLESGDESVLTSGPAWDYKPSPSPDSRWIAFSRAEEGPSSIWVVPAQGGEARRLTASGYNDRWPGWTAAGDRIFFHRLMESGNSVKVLDRATGAVREVVGREEAPLQASLHPDGYHLVYCSQHQGRKRLRVRDLLTGEARDLGDPHREACFPRWSPDGTAVGFVLRSAERWEVATIRGDGTELRVWTEGKHGFAGMDRPLDWSPDGRYLVFQSDTRAFESDLYILDTRDGTIRNLTQDGWWDEAPSWSPDGKSILYMSTRGGGWTWGLYRLSIGDGSVATVSPPDYVEKNYPRMAPGGEVLWTYRDGTGAERLALKAPDDRREADVPEVGTGARWPSYAAGGRKVVFTQVGGRVEYWTATNLAGGGSPLVAAGGEATPRARGALAATPRIAWGGAEPGYPSPARLNGRLVDVRSEWPARDRSPADKYRR